MEFSVQPDNFSTPDDSQDSFIHLSLINSYLTDPIELQHFSVSLRKISKIQLEKTERFDMKLGFWAQVITLASVAGVAILGCVILWNLRA
jgi:hypothetical protein